ncbi:hypothetical protein [Comamonas thiooxydans]|nr:hypothetical protein [Comamonas thiooxydans]
MTGNDPDEGFLLSPEQQISSIYARPVRYGANQSTLPQGAAV